MRTIYLLLLTFIVHAFLPKAYAQGSSGAGNGGKLIACYQKGNPHQKWVSATPLDYWEASQESSRIHISLGGNELSPYEKVKLIISRIRRLDPEFANELIGLLTQFRTLKDISNHYQINRIDDTKVVIDQSSLITPRGNCAEVQGAVQIREVDPIFNKKFFIDQAYWEIMDSDSKAGLIFHEILYWSEIKRGALDSMGTRRINAIFSSTLADRLTLMQYLKIMRRNSLRGIFSLNGVSVAFSSDDAISFSLAGQIAQGKLLKDYSLKKMGKEFNCLAGLPVEFDDLGQIYNCQVSQIGWEIQNERFRQRVRFTGSPVALTSLIEIGSKVNLTSLKFKLVDFEFQSKSLGLHLKGDASFEASFDSSGILKSFSTSQTSQFLSFFNNRSFFLNRLIPIGGSVDPTTGELIRITLEQVTGTGVPLIINQTNGKKYELSWKQTFDVELSNNGQEVGVIK